SSCRKPPRSRCQTPESLDRCLRKRGQLWEGFCQRTARQSGSGTVDKPDRFQWKI
ncbi:uncharacterized protein METZ01_LOCUS257901, partial [marine metagenome]